MGKKKQKLRAEANSIAKLGYWAGLAIAFLMGVANLGHETLWSHRLIDLLGCAGDATALVVSIFFLGGALGAISTRWLKGSHRSAWRWVGITQLLCAILSLPILYSPNLSSNIWPILGPENINSVAGITLKWFLGLLFLIPPAWFLGMALPLLTRGALSKNYPMEKRGAFLYGIGTIGGVIGVLLVAFGLAPFLGMVTSGWILFGVNIFCALAAFVLAPHFSETSDYETKNTQNQNVPVEFEFKKMASILSFGSGFGVMACEIIVFHQLNQILSSSLHSFALTLAPVLIALAIASFIAPKLIFFKKIGLSAVLWATAVAIALEPFLFIAVNKGLLPVALGSGILNDLTQAMKIAIVATVPIFILAGIVFPLTFSLASRIENDNCGYFWGTQLFFSGFGGLLGAQVAQMILMPFSGIWSSMLLLAALYALASCIVHKPDKWTNIWYLGRCSTVPICLILIHFSSSLPLLRPLVEGEADGEKAIESISGRSGIATATRNSKGELRILSNNRYPIGGTSSLSLNRQQMLVPLLLHQNPKHVCFIGMGSGMTASSALADNSLERLEVIEISPLIVNLSKKYFSESSGQLFRDKRSKVIIADGRLYLAASANRFDAIVADLFVPWREGVGRLYSLECFQSAKRALRKGGVFCQWLPLYQLSSTQLTTIIKTFRQVFPKGWMIRGSLSYRNPMLGLVGFKSGQIPTFQELQKRCAGLRANGKVNNVFLRQAEGIGMLLLGPLRSPNNENTTTINTLGNARIEMHAPLERMRQDWLPFSHDMWASFTRKLVADLTNSQAVDPEFSKLMFRGQQWIDAQEARMRKADNVKRKILEAIAFLPKKIAEDPKFDWNDLVIDVPIKLYGQRGAKYTPLKVSRRATQKTQN